LRLLVVLTELADLLRRYEQLHWSDEIESCRRRIDAGDAHGLDQFLGGFGGMGSLTDVLLYPADEGDTRDFAAANGLLGALRLEAYQLAMNLRKTL
jgi:hypothetical protein